MTDEQKREAEDAVEQFALQFSNLWDDGDILRLAKSLYNAVYQNGRPSLEAYRLNRDALFALIERFRDFADMTESALSDVNDILDDVEPEDMSNNTLNGGAERIGLNLAGSKRLESLRQVRGFEFEARDIDRVHVHLRPPHRRECR